MNVRVVFVDWYRTLSTSLFWQQSPGCRLSAADSASVESYVFSRAELLRQWMVGAVAAEAVCTLAAGSLGLPAADLLADLEHNCRSMEFDDPASAGAVQALREQGIKVVLATDNMDTFYRWTVPALRLGGMFDAILDSASLGVLKKDLVDGHSSFFGPWLSDQRIAPAEAVLVDDSPPASAAAIGLETRVVQDPGKLASVLTQLGAGPRHGCFGSDEAGRQPHGPGTDSSRSGYFVAAPTLSETGPCRREQALNGNGTSLDLV